MICRSCTPLTHDTCIWFPADCRMSWTLCSEVKVQVYCVHLFCGKRIVVIVAWLLILFVVIRLLPLVLFPRGPSSILVLLNVIPSVNPSPHSPRRPHWSVGEYYEGGCLCRAMKKTSYYKTGKSRPDEAWKHSFPKAPLKFTQWQIYRHTRSKQTQTRDYFTLAVH